ncbi:hypothetical protein G9298_29085 (plasmid) [Bacillus thuringiensis]|nr:hypothetical protein G9298_29085 [Bacillus thuringiensis]
MNPYQNKNEYEIIDSNASPYPSNKNINSARYPYAHSLNQPLQHTNYKDWLNLCKTNQQYGANPESLADSLTVFSAGVIVVGTLLTGFAATAGLGIGLISFGTLAPVLWPTGTDPIENVPNTQVVWRDFMRLGNAINPISDQLQEFVINTTAAKVEGLTNLINNYETELNSWKSSPPQDKQRRARDVLSAFDGANRAFMQTIPELRLTKYEVVQLISYAQAANLHVNLLSQGVRFKDEWDRDAGNISSFKTSKELHDDLLKYINDYTIYCVETYKTGLNKLKNASGIRWNIYNTYRREMTLNVLDLIALLPNYDLYIYDRPTKSELTREIYTDALNLDAPNIETDLDRMENFLTRPPHLFTWLQSFEFETNTNYKPNWIFLAGHRNFYSFTNGYKREGSSVYGTWAYPNNRRDPELDIPENSYIYRVLTKSYIYTPTNTPNINAINFFTTNNTQLNYYAGEPTHALRTTTFELPAGNKNPVTYNNYSHILSYMKSYNALDRLQANVFAWTHKGVNPKNTIDLDKITQIPAVKARTLDPSSQVIPGPGFTGGDLVHLKQYLEIQGASKEGTQYRQYYRIRIRYASNNPTPIYITIPNGVTNQFVTLNSTFSGTSYNNLKYENFSYKEFPYELLLTENTNPLITLDRRNTNNSILLIDKIEFIPENTTILESEGERNLEKAKNAVNNLFIN